MGFPGQEYWGGLPFPTPGDLPDPGIKPTSLAPPALAGRFFTSVPLGSPKHSVHVVIVIIIGDFKCHLIIFTMILVGRYYSKLRFPVRKPKLGK